MRPSLIKLIVIPVLVLSFQVNISVAEDKKVLNLNDCIDMALKNHPSIRAAERGVTVVSEQYRQTISSYYPQLTANGSYTRSESKSQTFVTGESEAYSAFLNLNQKIYDFGRTGGSVDAARYLTDQKGRDLSGTRQAVILNVKDGYFGVLKAKGLMAVQEKSVIQAEAHLRQAKGFYDAGAKAKFDVTNAEVELNQAKLNLIRAKNGLNTAIASLRNRMGVDYSYSLEIDPAFAKPGPPVSLDEGIKEALQQRPEMQSADTSIKAAEASVKEARGDYYPSLDANASYGYYDQYPVGEGENLFQEKNQRWSAGVSVTVPIFGGFITNAKVSEARANVDSLKAQRETLANDIILEVTQSYLDLQEAEASIGVAESGLNKAKENLDIANGRYEAGVGTIIEVTDAQTSYITSETDLINARHDAAIARANFDRAIGEQ